MYICNKNYITSLVEGEVFAAESKVYEYLESIDFVSCVKSAMLNGEIGIEIILPDTIPFLVMKRILEKEGFTVTMPEQFYGDYYIKIYWHEREEGVNKE